jgi:predicted DsbA family dithiol-disulfide isomerase
MTLTVTITSDFICPWCLIGERRLAKAINTLPEGTFVERKWRPFELNPDMRVEGMDRRTYRSLKFGSWERSQSLDAHTAEAAKGDDVAFNYAAMTKTPNTRLAHRLVWFAEREGQATPLVDAIFSAYFEHGRDIGDRDVLVEIAAENGWDREKVRTFLVGDEGTAEVSAAEQVAQQGGVRGVPLFEIAGETVSGAQSVAAFEAALRRAVAADQANSCDSGFCATS